MPCTLSIIVQGETDGMLDVWGSVLPKDPPAASPAAIPGMFASEQYGEAQLHALYVFRYLLVFVAALESFAHGANDTANATGAFLPLLHLPHCRQGILKTLPASPAGAFSAVWAVYRHGKDLGEECSFGKTRLWVMTLGGFFVFAGVYLMGHKVIKTMGFGLANINFFRGFCIELASAVSVVVATVLKMPVSTTHCQVCLSQLSVGHN
jgi:solute carrier family 20 (sodium-dependent phosphate transporter)